MKSSIQSTWLLCIAAVVVVAVTACGKQPPAQTRTEMAPAPQVAQETTPPPPDVNQQLKDRLSELGASQGDTGWVMALPSAHFKAGATAFEPADAERIDQVAALLKNRPDVKVMVQAFTDSHGSESRNLKLSQQRADAVQKALIDRGVDAARIHSEGRGEAQPVATNDTMQGREQNRRVEIVFSDADGRFASTDAPRTTG